MLRLIIDRLIIITEGKSVINWHEKMSCTDFRPMITKCPAVGCQQTEDVHWKHSSCETKVKINSEGIVRCSTCSFDWQVLQANWACTRHVGEYRPTDRSMIASALIIAFQVGEKSSEGDWKMRLIRSVSNQSFSKTTNLKS